MGPTPCSLKLSFLSFHSGREDIEYAMEVAGTFREPLDRQLTEKVNISFKYFLRVLQSSSTQKALQNLGFNFNSI